MKTKRKMVKEGKTTDYGLFSLSPFSLASGLSSMIVMMVLAMASLYGSPPSLRSMSASWPISTACFLGYFRASERSACVVCNGQILWI